MEPACNNFLVLEGRNWLQRSFSMAGPPSQDAPPILALTTIDHHHGDDGVAALFHGSPPPKKSALSFGYSMYSWSDLPKELVELIAEKLHYHADLQRFGSVCKPWRSVFVENHNRLPYRLPMRHCLPKKPPFPLLMRSCNKEGTVMDFFCVSNKNVYREFHLPELRKKKIVGSCNGWLLTIDTRDEGFHILNPLTWNQIQLPSYSSSLIGLGVNSEPPETDTYRFVTKVVLSADPKFSGRGDCVALAMAYGLKLLSCCRLGDDEWTSMKDPPGGINDAIYHEGRFLAVGSHGVVVAINDIGPNAKVKWVAGGPNSKEPYIPYPCRKYLVKSSSGKLLLVARMVDDGSFDEDIKSEDDDDDDGSDEGDDDDDEEDDGSDVGDDNDEDHGSDQDDEDDESDYDDDGSDKVKNDRPPYHYKTTSFAVFRLDCKELYDQPTQFFDPKRRATYNWRLDQQYGTYSWVKLESLDGDMLILGRNCSIALSSHLHPQGKPNCIFFTDDYLHRNPKLGIEDQGIYDMESGSIQPFPRKDGCFPMAPIWVMPNPW